MADTKSDETEIKHLTSENYDDVTSEGNVIVDFWAEWCGPCKQLAPIFKDVSEELDDYTFAKVDVEANQDLAGSVGVRGIPSLLFFQDGEEIGRHRGVLPKEALEKKIRSTFDDA